MAHIHSARGTQCIHNLGSHKLKLLKTCITMKCTTTVAEGLSNAVTEANIVSCCWPDGTADATLVGVVC